MAANSAANVAMGQPSTKVVVSSLLPPCNSVLQVALFEEKFKIYEMRGGTLGLKECLGDIVFLRLARGGPGKISGLSDEDLLAALYEAYKPTGVYEFLEVLREVRYSPSSDLCLGCGHVSTPPHRRRTSIFQVGK